MTTDHLLWGLLGYVLFPLWLIAGLADYWAHQRTSLPTTAGEPESRLHLLQAIQVGVPVLLVLFFELNLLALALLVAAAVAHTITAWGDLRYASQLRVILPHEQVAHAFLITLPLFATALLIAMHWPAASTPSSPLAPGTSGWALQLRAQPWPTGYVVLVLVASAFFGVLPAVVEWWQARKARRDGSWRAVALP